MYKRCLLLFVLAVLTLVGCSNDSTTRPVGEVKKNSSSPRAGGELVISDATDADTLDPHKATSAASMRYIENMYSTLLRYKKGTYEELEGDLATNYVVSDDGKTYTFTLQPAAKFHDGSPLTSRDVIYSIERIRQEKVRAPQFAAVKSIEALDDHTVRFHLKEPVAPFLTFLAYPMNAIVNQKVVEQHGGSIDRVDAGSGPFKLVEWKKNQRLVLEKFSEYFVQGRPYLDRVIWRPIPDDTSRTTAMRNREIDVMLQTTLRDIRKFHNNVGTEMKSVTGTFWEYVGLNTSKGPLANRKVRQAIAWAVDRDAINKVVKFGKADVLRGGPLPKSHWAYSGVNVYPKRDVEKAKQLLREAGYADGFDVTLKVSPKKEQTDAAQMVKQELQEVGIRVKVLVQEPSVFFDAIGKKDFEMAVVGWVGFVDPDEFFYNIFHTGEQWNQQAYSNPKVDALLERGRTVMNKKERKDVYAKAERMIAEDAPMVFLYMNPQTTVYTNRVHDFDVHPTVSTISLRDTWVDRDN
ncbi:ABC transporter substrate-binding protein [Aneurinibacillus sp. REN35]|uniref:ABC transporter substrate-binding protein n=1 Tax=Aneurinibacillus sp. REN35 TaxID=3237286 RepID=UPI00352977CF